MPAHILNTILEILLSEIMKDICYHCQYLETHIIAVSSTEGVVSRFCKIYNQPVEWTERCCEIKVKHKVMGKIRIFDDPTSIIIKLSEGNPGAINVCSLLIKEGGAIYPYEDGFEYIKNLDNIGIYGTDIYVLWNDICQCDLAKMISLLRIAIRDPYKANLLKDACGRQDYSGRKLLQNDMIFARVFN